MKGYYELKPVLLLERTTSISNLPLSIIPHHRHLFGCIQVVPKMEVIGCVVVCFVLRDGGTWEKTDLGFGKAQLQAKYTVLLL